LDRPQAPPSAIRPIDRGERYEDPCKGARRSSDGEEFMPHPRAVRTKFEHANPILSVADMKRSLRYYVDALGFSIAEWGGDDFTCVTRDGANIYLCEGEQGHPGTWVWLGVDDVEALYEEYKGSGAQILQPPQNFRWACEMKIGDPDGHVLRFGSDPKEET
jgi:predicted enzyme related to lactoylglutathione lyase